MGSRLSAQIADEPRRRYRAPGNLFTVRLAAEAFWPKGSALSVQASEFAWYPMR